MDIEQIFEFFSDLVSGKKPNGKIHLARIYGAYEREQEKIEKNKELDEKLRDSRRRYAIHGISDDMAIVQYYEDIFKDGTGEWYCPAHRGDISHNLYDSFDKALIALIASKTDNIQASEYIFKMLDMENGADV